MNQESKQRQQTSGIERHHYAWDGSNEAVGSIEEKLSHMESMESMESWSHGMSSGRKRG